MEILTQLTHTPTILALLGTSLLGVACGAVGTFAVLRERALVGDALAHAALPGVCVSFLLFGERTLPFLMAGAIVFGLLSVRLISFIRENSRIKEDAAIGIVLSCLFGLGISLSRIIQNRPEGSKAGLDQFIFGNAAAMGPYDVPLIGSVSLVALGTILALRKEFALLCFDRNFLTSLGFSASHLDGLLMLLVCLCAAVGLPAVGAVLISALLIIPAATARLWTDRVTPMLLLSCLFGFVGCVAGTLASAALPTPAGSQSSGFPTGPLIIVTCASIFFLSLLLSPSRGLLSLYHRRSL